MKFRLRFLHAVLVTVILVFGFSSFAGSQTINSGVAYLNSSQEPDGSWEGVTFGTESIPTTVAVLEALKALNQTGSSTYANAISWLQNQALDTTDYLSERIYALSVAGTDQDILLSYADELVSAWGGYDEYGVNNLDTSLALLALKRINFSDQNIISSALGFLLSTQNPDGGWGFYQGDNSNVYMTAIVVDTLSQYKSIYTLQNQINSGVAYLLTKQNPDGGFGTSSSTVYETALGFLALVESGANISTVAPQTISYLTSTQLPNGSWNDDPYSTALALRALAHVKPNLSIFPTDITFSNPNPKIGETITITATIYNEGPANADNVVVQFYDGDPSAGGTLIGETTIPTVTAFSSSQTNVNWTVPTASLRKVYVRIDPLNFIDELDETDNMAFRNLTSSTLPDLTLGSAEITFSPDPVRIGNPVTITVTVRNHGQSDAENFLVYVSAGDSGRRGVKVAEATYQLRGHSDSSQKKQAGD